MKSDTRENGSEGPFTIEQAKRAKRRAEVKRDNYGDFRKKHLPAQSEPADPVEIDHKTRRNTRIAHPSYDARKLPKPLVECGCGECSDAADPLADENEVWRDCLWAVEQCPSPQPLTVERAAEAYLTYQKALWNRPDTTSLYERTRTQHGQLLGGARDVWQQYDDPTILFCSLRLSPIEIQNGQRRWIEPIKLNQRLHDSWSNVYGTMEYQLRGCDYEYVAITASTDSAATPHTHLLIWADDPDNEVSIGVAHSIVQSHVNNTKGAYEKDHPVQKGQSDAGMVFHDPPRVPIDDETALEVFKTRGREGFPLVSPMLKYMADQRSHWALKNVFDGESDVHTNSVAVEGAAIEWASNHHWIKSSDAIELS